MLVIAPIGGALADRWDRRRMIMVGQALILTGEATTLALYASGYLRFWHLCAFGLLMGSLFSLLIPARQAIVVNIVGKARLGNAMALNMAGMNASRIIGPAIAGVLAAQIGLAQTYLCGVVLYVVAWITLLRLAPAPPAREMRRVPIATSVADAVRYLGDQRLVTLLLVFGLVPMLLMMPFQTLLPVFASDVWNRGTQGLGLLNAMSGLGGVTGSLLMALRGDAGGRLRLMVASVLGFGGFLALFGFSSWFGLALVLLLAANVFATVFGVVNNTAIQQLIPDQVRGRISSVLTLTFSLPMLGNLPVSALAQAYGAPFAVGIASLTAVAVAVALYLGSSTLRSLDEAVDRALS
jgi:MFS family permease